MPRIRQNEEKYAMTDFVAEINAQCGRYGYRSQKSIGNALGVKFYHTPVLAADIVKAWKDKQAAEAAAN